MLFGFIGREIPFWGIGVREFMASFLIWSGYMYAKYEFTEVFFLCLVFSIIPMMDFWGSGAYRLIVFLLIWAVYFANFGISIARLNTYFKRLMKDTFIDYDKSYKKKLL